jgi:threonine/homoserine/homoserine lactone efflux protein
VDYLAFAVVMLLGQFSPGPDMLLLLKCAVNHHLRAGLWTIAGIATGLAVHATVAVTGLAVVFRQSPVAARVLGVAGGAYLGWLAWQLLRSVFRAKPANASQSENFGSAALGDGAAFRQGLFTNLLNPKAALFLFSVLAAALERNPSTSRKIIFTAIIVGQALVFWSLFVWLLQRPVVRRLYRNSERWLNLLFGLGLAGLAITAILGGVTK